MRPTTWTVLRAVGRVTFFEILRDRILYSIGLVALVLLGITFIASQLSSLETARIVTDVGLSAVSIACSLIGIYSGSTVLNREFERRTAYVALSRPISRAQFVCGKYAGVALALALNWALLCVTFFLMILLFADSGGAGLLAQASSTLGLALLFVLLQALVLAALSLAISTYSSTLVSAMVSSGFFLVGINLSQLRMLAGRSESGVVRELISALTRILPDFEHFNLGLKVTYGLPVPASYACASFAYAICVTGVALGAAALLIRTKEN